MVITGATGAIGSALGRHFKKARAYDPREATHTPYTDVLINCIGFNSDSVMHKSDPWAWDRVVRTNLLYVADVIMMALPYMREHKYGRIINMSSVLANMGVAGTSAYAASKAGLNGMIKAIAVENAKHNILINNLNLGYMDLGMTHRIPNHEELKKKIPIGRFGHIDEIIRACEFLINSNYITGTCIDINGGLW